VSLPIYPISGAQGWPQGVRGLWWPVVKTMTYSTLLEPAASDLEVTAPLWVDPVWMWDLRYNYLKDDPNDLIAGQTDTDLHILQGFYGLNSGRNGQFLFFDPSDNLSGPLSGGVPGYSSQQLVQDSAGVYYTPIQRPLGGSSVGFYEDITDLKTDTHALAVKANGVATSAYTLSGPGFSAPGISFYGLVLVWNAQPALPITASFQFYFRARFDKDDGMETSWWSGLNSSGVRQLSKAASVKLITRRLAPAQ
jgi:hypothetical protein